MENRPGPWIEALRRSHDHLTALVEPLDAEQLQGRSYAKEWTIAQVLSHIGSQSEIFGLFLDAGLSGGPAPGRESFGPIWDAWNARPPRAQATDAMARDAEVVARFEQLDPEQLRNLHLTMFGMELDSTGLARMRLGEHALHTWDIAVALDPTAEVAPDAVNLLIDTLDQLVGRAGHADGVERRVHVVTTSPDRVYTLETGETVTLTAGGETSGHQVEAELRLPGAALVRLVYGRLDSAHSPALKTSGIELDDLRRMFPGF